MTSTLVDKDRHYVWHPFTQHHHAQKHLVIERAKGSYLYTPDGRQIIDAISSWWVINHGHCHPYLTQKIQEQLPQLDHVIFAGVTHQPAVALASRLIQCAPGNMAKVFYSDNGSTAVEVALKLALQYWFNQGVQKKRVVAFRHSYHGDTFGAMSVAERNAFNQPFWDKLFHVDFIDPPLRGKSSQSLRQLKELLKQSQDVACFIFEPLVQGAGGMLMQTPEALNELLIYAKSQGILCIADEVMTGFGRTGRLFATDYLEEKPDIVCLAKGLTGGVLPLSATLCSNEIYEQFLSSESTKAFFHGHSFTANPVGCSAGLASLDLMERAETAKSLLRIEASHCAFQKELLSSSYKSYIKDSRVLGTILALELKSIGQSGYFNKLADHMKLFFSKQDVLLRPLGNVLYVLPPYCVTNTDLKKIYDVILAYLRELKK